MLEQLKARQRNENKSLGRLASELLAKAMSEPVADTDMLPATRRADVRRHRARLPAQSTALRASVLRDL